MGVHDDTTLRGQLLYQAKAFCEAEGITLPTLGRLVLNDTGFFARVEGGAGFTVRTYEKFQRHFAENRSAA